MARTSLNGSGVARNSLNDTVNKENQAYLATSSLNDNHRERRWQLIRINLEVSIQNELSDHHLSSSTWLRCAIKRKTRHATLKKESSIAHLGKNSPPTLCYEVFHCH